MWVLISLGLWMFPRAVLHSQRSDGGAVFLLKSNDFRTDLSTQSVVADE